MRKKWVVELVQKYHHSEFSFHWIEVIRTCVLEDVLVVLYDKGVQEYMKGFMKMQAAFSVASHYETEGKTIESCTVQSAVNNDPCPLYSYLREGTTELIHLKDEQRGRKKRKHS
jgi:hypothetical protein